MSRIVLVDQWLCLARRKLRDDPPALAASGDVLVRMLDPDNRNALLSCLLDQGADVRDDGIALMRSADNSVLHVDDDERGPRPVLECGHGSPLIALVSCAT